MPCACFTVVYNHHECSLSHPAIITLKLSFNICFIYTFHLCQCKNTWRLHKPSLAAIFSNLIHLWRMPLYKFSLTDWLISASRFSIDLCLQCICSTKTCYDVFAASKVQMGSAKSLVKLRQTSICIVHRRENLTSNALRCGSHSVTCQSHHTCLYRVVRQGAPRLNEQL